MFYCRLSVRIVNENPPGGNFAATGLQRINLLTGAVFPEFIGGCIRIGIAIDPTWNRWKAFLNYVCSNVAIQILHIASKMELAACVYCNRILRIALLRFLS